MEGRVFLGKNHKKRFMQSDSSLHVSVSYCIFEKTGKLKIFRLCVREIRKSKKMRASIFWSMSPISKKRRERRIVAKFDSDLWEAIIRLNVLFSL